MSIQNKLTLIINSVSDNTESFKKNSSSSSSSITPSVRMRRHCTVYYSPPTQSIMCTEPSIIATPLSSRLARSAVNSAGVLGSITVGCCSACVIGASLHRPYGSPANRVEWHISPKMPTHSVNRGFFNTDNE